MAKNPLSGRNLVPAIEFVAGKENVSCKQALSVLKNAKNPRSRMPLAHRALLKEEGLIK